MDVRQNISGNSRSISDVYSGKSIFVTGATGFVGKVFLEKILYSCPKISKVYILIRGKQNMSIDERIKKILNIPLFDRLRNERPQDFDKIVPVNGDICLPKLGLKQEDEDMLLNTISMVFHIAANVKFNEPLEIAMTINVKGTKSVLELCQRIRNLKAFVYVSTAFTNSNLEFVGERVYPPPVPLDEAEKLTDRSISKEETAKLLNGRINTYTFSKEVAENLVAKYQGVVPSAIVRPSIVVSSKSEPVAGWVDNWYGATGIILPLAQGVNRVMLSDPKNIVDLIPVDYVANAIILAATRCEGSQEVAVYNCSSSCENPIEMNEFIRLSAAHCVNLKFNVLPFPMFLLTKSKWLVNVIVSIQKLPLIILDWVLYAMGKQPRYVKYQQKALKSQESAENFTKRSWKICAERTCALYASLSETDREHFPCDPRNIVWAEFLLTYMEGIKKYLWGSTDQKKRN